MTVFGTDYKNLMNKEFTLIENKVISDFMKMWREQRPIDYRYIIVYQADPSGESYDPRDHNKITTLKDALRYISIYKQLRPIGYNKILSALSSDISNKVTFLIDAYELNNQRSNNFYQNRDWNGHLKQHLDVAKMLPRKKKITKIKSKRKICSCKKK